MPRPSPGCPAAASGWSPVTAKVALCIAQSRWPGAGRGGRRMAATTASRPARATVPHRLRAATRPLSVAMGRPSGHRGADTSGRLATRRHQARVRSSPRSRPRTRAAPRLAVGTAIRRASLVPSSTQSSEPSAIGEVPCRSCRGSMASSVRDLPLPGRVRSRGRMPT
jgi:hypothetical protein